jgi:hypothetical protein
LITILIVALSPRLDADLWWHLRTGQLIVEQHAFQRADPFSFTAAGKAWTDHEWLAEVVFYGLERGAGAWGVIVLCALLLVGAYSFAAMRMRASGVSLLVTTIVTGLAFYASTLSWGPRVQTVTTCFAAFFGYAIDQVRRGGSTRWLVAMVLATVVWANAHGGFIVGAAMLMIAAAGSWLDRSPAMARRFAFAALAALAVSLLNPNGLDQLTYPFRFLKPNPYTMNIIESQSPPFRLPSMLAFELLLLATIAAALRAKRRLDWTNILLLVAFTHLALSQTRNVALWSVVAAPIAALAIDPIGRRELPRMRAGLAAAAAAAVVIVIVAAYRPIGQRALESIEVDYLPAGGAIYLQRVQAPPNLFITYDWGGYAIWKLWPRYRVFIDGRADTLYGDALLRDYLEVHNGEPRAQEVLDRYGVGTVLVERTSFAAHDLARNPRWQLLYADHNSAVFARRGTVTTALPPAPSPAAPPGTSSTTR